MVERIKNWIHKKNLIEKNSSHSRPLGPASRKSSSLIWRPAVAMSSDSDSDLTTVTSKWVDVGVDDHRRLDQTDPQGSVLRYPTVVTLGYPG